MEQCFQANKEVEELQKLQLRKCHKPVDKYQNVSARVVTNFREKKKYQDDNINIVSKDNINPTLTDKMENNEQKSLDEIDTLEDIKHIAISKKIIGTEMDSNTSGKQKKQVITCKRNQKYSQQKLQPKVSSEPNVHKLDNSVNNMNVQNTVKYKSQGIQTLDTDQMESIYSEGIIR